MERDKKKHETTKEFVEKYWPALIAGATVVGATVWLVARYIKENKSKKDEIEALTELEHEALSSSDGTSIILETGAQLSKVAGDEVAQASKDLLPHLDDDGAKSTLTVLDNLATLEKNRRSKNS